MRRFVLTTVLALSIASSAAAAEPPTIDRVRVLGDTVSIAWTHTAEHYTFEAGSAPSSADLAQIAVTTNTLTFVGVPAGTYHVRVRSHHGVSKDAAIAVSACVAGITPPTQLRASVVRSRLTLYWTRSASCGVTYRLHAGSRAGVSDLAAMDLGTADTFAVDAPQGLYYVRVIAVNQFGVSAATNEVAVAPGFDVSDALAAPATVHVLPQSVSYVAGVEGIGVTWLRVLGEVRNATGQTVVSPTVHAVVRAASGALLEDTTTLVFGTSQRWLTPALAPGASGCFGLWTRAPMPAVASVDLAVSYLSYPLPAMQTNVIPSNVATSNQNGHLTFTGTVTNGGARTAVETRFFIWLKNSSDGRVADCTTTLAAEVLPPGSSAAFTLQTRVPFGTAVTTAGQVMWREP